VNQHLEPLVGPTDVLASAADRLVHQVHQYRFYMLTQPMIDAMRANATLVRIEVDKLEALLAALKETAKGTP
jgi:hypothetical protein